MFADLQLPDVPVLLVSSAFSVYARLLKLFDLRHALLVHLLVLVIQPAAQNDAQNCHQQTEGSRDPHAFAIVRFLVSWEDVGTWIIESAAGI